MIDLNKAAQRALKTARARERKGHVKSGTFDILKHCAGEVCEAVEAYATMDLLRTDMTENHDFLKERFADELADIITCALIAAAQEKVDIEAALLRVQEKNERRVK